MLRLALLACALVLAAAAFAPADDRAPVTGRELYAREACWQCHVHAGDPSFPPVEGTGRTGPVLGGPLRPVRSREWLRAFFHEPRELLPESVMPAYPGYFARNPNADAVRAFVARHDRRDGSLHEDGIVTRDEYGGSGGTDWEGDLARLDALGDGVVSAADAAPLRGAALERLLELVDAAGAAPPPAPGPPPAPPRRDAAERERAIERGQRLYLRNCAGCHGARGDGNGPAARFFGDHPPRNFLRGEYRFRSSPVGDPPFDGDLFATIRRGAGPSMPPWPSFTDAQVWDLVEFLKSHHPAYVPKELFVEGEGGFAVTAEEGDPAGGALGAGRVGKRAGHWWWVEDGTAVPVRDGLEVAGRRLRLGAPVFAWQDGWEPRRVPLPGAPFPSSAASVEIGAKVYAEFGCGECHGAGGRGDGPAATRTRGSLGEILRPADYTRGPAWLKGGADDESLVRTFVTGLAGTPMPAYDFSTATSAPPEKAAWHLAHFVRSMR